MEPTTPQARIEADVKTALKAGEKERLGTLRMLLADIKNERTKPGGGEVDEAVFLTLVRRAIKRREEATVQYRNGNRPELAAKEEAEAAMLAVYLPAQPDAGDIRAAVAEFVAAQGLSGPSALGPVMKEMKGRFPTADGAVVNRIVREVLSPA
jgi:uncharacterized protein YqeY